MVPVGVLPTTATARVATAGAGARAGTLTGASSGTNGNFQLGSSRALPHRASPARPTTHLPSPTLRRRHHHHHHPRPAYARDAPASAATVTVHYYRHDGEALAFGLHCWYPGVEAAAEATKWDAPLPATRALDGEWVTFDVPIAPGAEVLSLIIHRGDEQDSRVESLDVSRGARSLWLVSGNADVFESEPDLTTLPTGDVDLGKARAIWVSAECIAVPFAVEPDTRVELVAASRAGLYVDGGGVVCGHEYGDVRYVPLELDPRGWTPPDAARAGDKYPHVRAAGYTVMRVPREYADSGYVPWLLKCQLAVQSKEADGSRLRDATSVQNHGAVDDVFGSYEGPLGCQVRRDGVSVRLWAPTAVAVTLRLFDAPHGGEPFAEIAMEEREGVWGADGGAEWIGRYYQYKIEVFHPWADGPSGNVTVAYVTDPYSRSLSADGEYTHVCDVDAPELKPPGWDTLQKPNHGRHPTDYAIYELHVRDFSAMDESVPWDLRGKYGAFARKDATCVRHLASLADAGLTHVHLLPSYDFGSVPERAEHQRTVDHEWLASLPSNSDQQQAAVGEVARDDAFNWGYDPVHYGVPEGSYSTDPDGSRRVLEFREMVAGLADVGLRTVCDVVYNHTLSAGPTDRASVLDKVVPGYYHRRNFDGGYENSTCCNNTASENSMMERLIVDDLVHWAVEYKVDGFRFDLMGHLMLRAMTRARDALQSLTLEHDGVDGASIYLYGEGWDYAEVERNRVGVNASQLNLGGTGIGSFNDRLREGIMGGSPFGDPRVQGVLTGLYFAPNGFIEQGDEAAQRARVVEDSEKVLIAMAGNLREYTFTNKDGYETPGRDAAWVGSNVGYAAEPRETVNYVSAHDNETLFDGIMLRSASHVSLAERCRLNRVAVAVVALSQGVPFFHAGDEILRSKSLDRDSYNSGDWFNRLDYTGETHNFGIGLPGREKNGDRYPFIGDLLGNLALRPDKAEIARSTAHMREVLAIRKSSPLFRLRTAADVQRRVTFYNTGPTQTPGLIVMGITDDPADGVEPVCPRFSRVLVCVNFSPHEVRMEDPALAVDLADARMTAHPLQGTICADEYLLGATCVAGAPVVPGHTVCAFVCRRDGA